jgi:hypothetical protein
MTQQEDLIQGWHHALGFPSLQNHEVKTFLSIISYPASGVLLQQQKMD